MPQRAPQAPLTFLFTDLESSTELWEQSPDAMRPALARHDALLKAAIEGHAGRIVKTTGDGLHAVFASAADGAAAALAGQQALRAEAWPADTGPLRVRMGLHTGDSEARDGDYFGPELNRAARITGAGHGGQILVSEATAVLLRPALASPASLADLGDHRLKGLADPMRIFQLCQPNLISAFPPLKSLAAFQHNLHPQLSSFIGREKELADVQRLLAPASAVNEGARPGGERLVTLLGPGGTGKTRLMLQAAEEMVDQFRDGVWLVELAPLTDPGLIAERVAAALNVQEQPGRPMLDTLVDYARHKDMLLLLDNVEHLVRECAVLAERLLEHCPRLKLLVTGREALFIAGETTLQIPSLSLPAADERSLEAVAGCEAVQLFLARARAVRPDFALTPDLAPAVAEIVRRLDGIPLALELAAARLRMLTVEQIAERLNDRFRLLTGGRRTALPRQQTLQALIDWSWNLLHDHERILLRRLSVFSGGWTLEAAQSVVSDERLDAQAIFDHLEQLINKSLVTAQIPAAGEARYGLLETIRQYARDKLFEAREGETLRDRHAGWMLAFAEAVGPQLFWGAGEVKAVQRLVLELDNLRAVLAWTVEDRLDLALRLCGQLFYADSYWMTTREVLLWLEPVVDKARSRLWPAGAAAARADFIRVLGGLVTMYVYQGIYDRALAADDEMIWLARDLPGEPRLLAYGLVIRAGMYTQTSEPLTPRVWQEVEEGIALCRQHGYRWELVWGLSAAAGLLVQQGKTEAALTYFAEVLATAREFHTPRGDAMAHYLQATKADMEGNLAEAKANYLAMIEFYEAMNDRRQVLSTRSDLAHVYRREGNLAEAEAYYRRNILAWQERGQLPAVAHQLECFAFLAIAHGRHAHAARLLGAATAAREHLLAFSTKPVEIAERAQALEQLAVALGAAERDRVMAEGRLISLDGAVVLALGEASMH